MIQPCDTERKTNNEVNIEKLPLQAVIIIITTVNFAYMVFKHLPSCGGKNKCELQIVD